jgi:hypothetical protein
MQMNVFWTGTLIAAAILFLMLLCWFWQSLKCRGAVEMVNTIPLEQCRKILGKDCPESDAELQLLRDHLYAFAGVVVEACPRQRPGNAAQNIPGGARRAIEDVVRGKAPSKPAGFPEALAMLPEEDRYGVEERAAIHEFDGQLDPEAAERFACSEYRRAKPREN